MDQAQAEETTTSEKAPRRRGKRGPVARPEARSRSAAVAQRERKGPAQREAFQQALEEGEAVDGIYVHSPEAADGSSRWQHELFPWDQKTRAQMERYDEQDAKYGHPTILRVFRRAVNGTLVTIPRDFAPGDLTARLIAQRYGGGTYIVRAYATKLVDNSTRTLDQCTRLSQFILEGRQKPIEADYDDDPPGGEEEEEEEEIEEEEEEEDEIEEVIVRGKNGKRRVVRRRVATEPHGVDREVQLAELRLRQIEAEGQRAKRERDDDQTRRDQAYERERQRDRDAHAQQMQMMMGMWKMQSEASSAPQATDRLMTALVDIAKDRLQKGGESPEAAKGQAAEIIRAIAEPLLGTIGEVVSKIAEKQSAKPEPAQQQQQTRQETQQPAEEGEQVWVYDCEACGAEYERETEHGEEDKLLCEACAAKAPPTGVPAPQQVAPAQRTIADSMKKNNGAAKPTATPKQEAPGATTATPTQ